MGQGASVIGRIEGGGRFAVGVKVSLSSQGS